MPSARSGKARKVSPAKFDFTLEPRQLRARVRALEALVLALYAHLDLRPEELGAVVRHMADKWADPKAIRDDARATAMAVIKRGRRIAG